MRRQQLQCGALYEVTLSVPAGTRLSAVNKVELWSRSLISTICNCDTRSVHLPRRSSGSVFPPASRGIPHYDSGGRRNSTATSCHLSRDIGWQEVICNFSLTQSHPVQVAWPRYSRWGRMGVLQNVPLHLSSGLRYA